MPYINLESSDGIIFKVDVDIVKCWLKIKSMLKDLDMNAIVPLPDVNSVILKKTIEWAVYHIDDPLPAEDDINMDIYRHGISSWDANFFNVDRRTLFELNLAANYLGIKGLFDVTCTAIGNMIKGKSVEEIRKMYMGNEAC